MKRIYLDNNATAFLDPSIAHYLQSVLDLSIANPSSVHNEGQKSRSLIQTARAQIASSLEVKPQELIFTSGATEGMNLLIQGFASSNSQKMHIITSSVEHACVFQNLHDLELKGHTISYLAPGEYGAIQPEQVKAAMTPQTSFIVLMAANNETGVKTDIEAIAKIANQAGIPFLVDGVAILGKEKFFIPEGVTAMCFSGHKAHALQGIGVIFLRSKVKLTPLLKGGPQEFGLRPGSENVLGMLSLAKAFQLIDQTIHDASLRMKKLRDLLETSLLELIPNTKINGLGPRVVNTTNLAFPDVDGESLLIALDQKGIAASHGSACSSGALEPSRVLLNMGISLKQVHASIRFSVSRLTTEQEIKDAIPIIVQTVKGFTPNCDSIRGLRSI